MQGLSLETAAAWLRDAVALRVENWGEPATLAVAGLLTGVLFGALAQRSRFCLRAAVISFAHGRIDAKVAVWLIAFTAAVLGTQALVHAGFIDVSQSRVLSGVGSVSGALIGGALFGTGMVLTRGCASRLLVLSATGNLRALLSGLVFVVVAQASYRGVLAPLREWLARLWTIEGPWRDVTVALSIGPDNKLMIASVAFLGALAFAVHARLSARFLLGAIGVGLAVVLAWTLTALIAQASFEPVPVKAITFSGPSAEVLMYVLQPAGRALDFDLALVPGVFLGAFVAALLGRELKVEMFSDAARMPRYIIGATLMGFGAMLAGGCAVGAGISGGSVFATTAWLALGAMWLAAGLTDRLIDTAPPAIEAPAAPPEAPAGAVAAGSPAPAAA